MGDTRLDRWINQVIEEARNDVTAKANVAVKNAGRRMSDELRTKIEQIFKESVDAFYGNYTPSIYLKKRRGTMYNVLVINGDSEETVGNDSDETELFVGYKPEAMTFRDGGTGLFDQAFAKGWHGGAASGPYHPHPGTPYWRRPVDDWYMWGRPAKIEETPPQEVFEQRVHEYDSKEGPERFQQIVDEEMAAQGLVVSGR